VKAAAALVAGVAAGVALVLDRQAEQRRLQAVIDEACSTYRRAADPSTPLADRVQAWHDAGRPDLRRSR
jgi:hypothetical protein